MKINCSSITDIVKSIEGKRFLVQCKPKSFERPAIDTLKPLTDLDNEIVSYGVGIGNRSLVDTVQIKDISERMSFEKVSMGKDPMRTSELYRFSTDYRPVPSLKYDEDDVSLSPTILQEVKRIPRVDKSYYPDTDFSFDNKCVLKHIDFVENIVPTSFDSKLHVGKDVINKYATEALHAWENDVPTSDIVRLIGKSVIDGKGLMFSKPSIELFSFLTKFPNARPFVIFTSKSGVEHLDVAALRYYNIFGTKHFSDEKVVQDILNICKTKRSFPIKTVDDRLCEIASLTRKKPAHGIEVDRSNLVDCDAPIFSRYCDKDTEWRPCDTKLIEKIKENGEVDEAKYTVARMLLRDMDKSVDYTLENLDKFAEKYKDINYIDNLFKRNLAYSYEKQRGEIHDFLDLQFRDYIFEGKDRDKLQFNIDCIKYLAEKNIAPTQVLRITDILGNGLNCDFSTKKDIIEFSSIHTPKNAPNKIDLQVLYSLTSLLRKTFDSNIENKSKLFDLIKLGLKNDKKSGMQSAILFLADNPKCPNVTIDSIKNLSDYYGKLNLLVRKRDMRYYPDLIDKFLEGEKIAVATTSTNIQDCGRLKLLEEYAKSQNYGLFSAIKYYVGKDKLAEMKKSCSDIVSFQEDSRTLDDLTVDNLRNLSQYFEKLDDCFRFPNCYKNVNRNIVKPELMVAADKPFKLEDYPILSKLCKLADSDID